MSGRLVCARVLTLVGSVAMLVGAIDPLEGSVIILPGSALVAVGALVGRKPRGLVRYWMCVFALIAAGVSGMFIVSAFGGLGGAHGLSMWWGLCILPYPIGWLMGVSALLLSWLAFIKMRRYRAHG